MPAGALSQCIRFFLAPARRKKNREVGGAFLARDKEKKGSRAS
jgi:hypothetical protein